MFGLAILAHVPVLATVYMGLVADTCTQGSNVVGTIAVLSLPLWLALTVWIAVMLYRLNDWKLESFGRAALRLAFAAPVLVFAVNLLPIGLDAAMWTLSGVNPCGPDVGVSAETIETAGALASLVICTGSMISVLALALVRAPVIADPTPDDPGGW